MVDVGAVTVGNVAEGRALRTERLVLRRWLDEDLEPFAALNADPVVMELLGPRLTRDQSDAYVARVETGFAERGYGLWAVEVPGTAPCLVHRSRERAFTACDGAARDASRPVRRLRAPRRPGGRSAASARSVPLRPRVVGPRRVA